MLLPLETSKPKRFKALNILNNDRRLVVLSYYTSSRAQIPTLCLISCLVHGTGSPNLVSDTSGPPKYSDTPSRMRDLTCAALLRWLLVARLDIDH